MHRWIVICVLFFCIPFIAFSEERYAGEKKVILDMVEAMETYNAAMDDAQETGQVAQANNALSDSLEILAPKMKTVAEEHPEWGDAPSDEVRPLMDRYMEVFMTFTRESLNKAVEYANTYTEDQELQDSFRRLNIIIWNLN